MHDPGDRPSQGSSPRLGRSHLDEEAIELSGEIARLRGQMPGGVQNFLGSGSSIVGGALHAGDVGIDILGTARSLLNAAGDLLGGGALFFDCGRNGGADLIDLGDDVGDVDILTA